MPDTPRLGCNQFVVWNFPLTDQKDHDTGQHFWEFPRFLHSIGNRDDQPDAL